MDLTFTPEQLAFRDELRAWLAEHGPAGSLGEEPDDEDESWEWRREWQRTLSEGGWAGVHWPKEVGGRGASLTETAIFFEELGRSGSPLPADVLGILLAGPTLMSWGDDAQQERLLPTILSADETWCQGFSEPDAGSDFAAVKTRAVKADPDDPDSDWLITGQKVWTSGAQYAKWCMLVARTGDGRGGQEPGAKKHQGLTYFVLDMEQEEVDVRPLVQITGSPEFNELFLTDARVPQSMVVGGVGNGWKVALTTLMNERAGLAFFLQVRLRQALDRLVAVAQENGSSEDPVISDRLADLHLRTEALRLMAWKGLTAIEQYGQPGPEGSLTKWLWSETNQLLVQLAVDVVGAEALTADSRWGYELLRARGNSIEGGTTEIQKTIIAERVLGLPRAS
ncbi:acyl-CoA dehydrogenase family protein [Patulibacter minatonensis]|uniref:acyl-CoA dehydrogenase family protein n=1 Tax=Patulibacter minatonensis TaxID=298163 RepID=UPI00047971D3|nr:acyl-CoA dehydrogenase family protein [Patulibacter minatonensis]